MAPRATLGRLFLWNGPLYLIFVAAQYLAATPIGGLVLCLMIVAANCIGYAQGLYSRSRSQRVDITDFTSKRYMPVPRGDA